jgi:hypothetical protein
VAQIENRDDLGFNNRIDVVNAKRKTAREHPVTTEMDRMNSVEKTSRRSTQPPFYFVERKKLRFPAFDLGESFANDVLMPSGRLNATRISGQSTPEKFHGFDLLFRAHLLNCRFVEHLINVFVGTTASKRGKSRAHCLLQPIDALARDGTGDKNADVRLADLKPFVDAPRASEFAVTVGGDELVVLGFDKQNAIG